jgi:hypothetical protein
MTEQTQEKVQLSLQDIATVIQMIDVASRRGAFEGRELAGVGMLRNKFELFLQQNAPQGEQPQGSMPAAVPEGPLSGKVED